MKMLKIVGAVAIIGVIVYGCSREDRDEVLNRVDNAARALNGSEKEKTPRVVKETQREELNRQDTTWTPENIAAYPIEFCQAQLKNLSKRGRALEARVHEKSCALAAVKRTMSDDEAMEKGLTKFLGEAKKIYRDALASNTWPVTMGGYSLSQDKAKQKIIDAAQKISEIQSRAASLKNNMVNVEKALNEAQNEQREIVRLRDQLQNKISNIKLKKVIKADDGLKAELAAISNNMAALGSDYDDPSIESIIQPDSKTTRDELFEKIMAE